MHDPKRFTVLVPTRDRADTLVHALRTCVMQDYERLEIIVSDNCSTDATADAVASFKDPRVRHVRTERRISMAQNWEFALGHVDDGFVLVVGDDDALLPNAIREIAAILDETGCEAMGWEEAKYFWPSCGGGIQGNVVRMSLRTGWQVVSTRDELTKVTQFRAPYRRLPSLYWGVVSRAAMRRATDASGRFFQSLNPDLYSALAPAMVVTRHVWSDRAYRLNGISRHSTGVSFANVDKQKASPREAFLNEGNLPFHSSYVLVPSSPIYVAEAYAQARDHVAGGADLPPIPAELVIEEMMRVAASDHEAAYALVVDGVREIAARAQISADAVIARHPRRDATRTESPRGISLSQRSIKLEGDDFGIRDVHGAAWLAYTITRLLEVGYLSPLTLLRRAWSSVRGRVTRMTGSAAQ